MKKLLAILLACVAVVSASAQSKYINAQRADEYDSFGDLRGAGGVQLLSKISNLTAYVTNDPSARIAPRGQNADGFYQYDILVDPKFTPNPKIEISKLGDPNRISITAEVKPNNYSAYIIDEFENPIKLDDQSAPNDAYLDAKYGEVEVSGSLDGLKVVVPKALNAQVTESVKPSDQTVKVISVVIPIATIDAARTRADKAQKDLDVINAKLKGASNPSMADIDAQEALEIERDAAVKELDQMRYIMVHANGTNVEKIDVANLSPRAKKVWAVIPLTVIKEVHSTESNDALLAANQFFAKRDYVHARESYEKALKAKDVDRNDLLMLSNYVAMSDSCLYFERLSKAVVDKLMAMKKSGTASQADLVRYANAGIDQYTRLQNYNPTDFYARMIAILEKMIANQPLEVHFTVVKFVNDYSGFFEGGPIPGAEVWAYYGQGLPTEKDSATEKKFRKLVAKSSDYKQLDSTDANGEIDLKFDRANLPTAIVFRPTSAAGDVKTKYYTMREILANPADDFNKRQIRIKMYTAPEK